MPYFLRSNIPSINKYLNRSPKLVEIKKTCAHCGKVFCQRKGRAKAAMVSNMPGRYICRQCLNRKPQPITLLMESNNPMR